MTGVNSTIRRQSPGQAEFVPSREETQRKLDARSEAAIKIKPGDLYNLGDRVEEKADTIPDRPFLIYKDRRYTYGEVEIICNQYANAFLARGIKAGDVCAVAMENRLELFFCWFSLVKIGAVATFINYHLRGNPLLHVLESTRAKVVLVGEECVEPFIETPECAGWPQWLMPDDENPASAAQLSHFDTAFTKEIASADTGRPDRQLRAHVRAEDAMLYIFTSGTTGLPKAAKYSHMRWMGSGDVMEVTLNATTDDVFYCCLPLYHGAAATSVTSTALKAGASIVIRRKFSTSGFWPDVHKYGVTVFQYIGEICRYLLNTPSRPDEKEHTLRCMLGAGLTGENWRRWIERFGHVDVYEGWGSTESNTATINVDNYIGSCGRIPDWSKTNLRLLRFDQETQTHVRDENGFCVHCEPGEVGEAVGFIVDSPEIGAGRFEGYTSPAATESKILRNVFTKDDAWWSSGDLLRYDDEGYCYFVDRIGDTYRWKSENVSTQEVAEELGSHPGLELINIYGVQVPEHEGRVGMALIVMQDGHEFVPETFFQFVTESLPHYARPAFVRVAGQADMTTTFKHRKIDLQKQGYDPSQFTDPVFVKDDANETYSPYNDDVLQRNGFPPFAGSQV